MKKEIFKPAWWLKHSHLQTLWPTLCRRSIQSLQLKRERFFLPDGDFVDLDWSSGTKGPIVLILHGFEGSIDSPYAKGMLNAIHAKGWRGVFMHFRSCSGESNRLARLYHSGETQDVARVVADIRRRYSQTPIAAVGFSLGGNVLLKWLGETQAANPLSAAVAVSVPFELRKAAMRINQGFSRVYQWRLLKSVCHKVQSKFQQMPPPFPLPVLSDLRSMREFDDQVTAPLHGFIDADDYYAQSSSRSYLKKISVPTLLLHAKDDPFMTPDSVPMSDELSSYVKLELSEHGGHVGFVGGKYPWNPEYWLEQRVPMYLESCFGVGVGD